MADEDDVCSFYGAVVNSGKGTEVKVKPGRVLLLKQAALAKPAGAKDRVTLSVKCDGQELVVCSLTQSCEQVCIERFLERFVDAATIEAHWLSVIWKQCDENDIGEVDVLAQVLANLNRLDLPN